MYLITSNSNFTAFNYKDMLKVHFNLINFLIFKLTIAKKLTTELNFLEEQSILLSHSIRDILYNVYQDHRLILCRTSLNTFHFQRQTELFLSPKLFLTSAHQRENQSYFWVRRQDEQQKVHEFVLFEVLQGEDDIRLPKDGMTWHKVEYCI